jgi:hypothetical protein
MMIIIIMMFITIRIIIMTLTILIITIIQIISTDTEKGGGRMTSGCSQKLPKKLWGTHVLMALSKITKRGGGRMSPGCSQKLQKMLLLMEEGPNIVHFTSKNTHIHAHLCIKRRSVQYRPNHRPHTRRFNFYCSNNTTLFGAWVASAKLW